MPRKTERHAAVLDKLKSVVQHTDSKVAAERRLAIERWVKTYIRQVEYLIALLIIVRNNQRNAESTA